MTLVGWKRFVVQAGLVLAASLLILWCGVAPGLQYWQPFVAGALLSIWGDMRFEDGRRKAVRS